MGRMGSACAWFSAWVEARREGRSAASGLGGLEARRAEEGVASG